MFFEPQSSAGFFYLSLCASVFGLHELFDMLADLRLAKQTCQRC